MEIRKSQSAIRNPQSAIAISKQTLGAEWMRAFGQLFSFSQPIYAVLEN